MRKFVAVCVCALTVAAVAPHKHDYHEDTRSAPKVQQSLQSVAAAQYQIAAATNTGEYQKPCDDGQANNKSELCAEWYAARAARDSADWAFYAMLVSIIGAVGIVVALLLTIDSNAIARRSARRELRAYMTWVQAPHSIDDDGLKFQIEWVNRGKTPARASNSYADWKFFDGQLPEEFDFPEPAPGDEDGPPTIGPGQSLFTSGMDPIPQELIVEVAAGTKRVYLWGAVNYVDVFGSNRRTEFAAKLHASHARETFFDLRLNAIGRHNDIDEHCDKRPEGHQRPARWRRLVDAFRHN